MPVTETLTNAIALQTLIQGGSPGERPTLLCLHGHPGSGDCMAVFTDNLSRRFRTLAPDLRGYGRSPAPGPFAMADHLTDLEALLEREQVGDFYLLGWSLGGILALELALRHPQRVKGIILVATAAHPRSNHPKTDWTDDLLTGIAGLINAASPGARWNIEAFGKRSLFRYLVEQQTPETYRYLAQYALPAYLQTSRWANQALSNALRARYNRLDAIQAITCPCLMLAAAGDRHITAQSSLETANHLPDCESKVYDNAAHLFPWEIPQPLLADINQWLDRQPGLGGRASAIA
jgi:pimeloyl-ACP methyl ester carboxylesterase